MLNLRVASDVALCRLAGGYQRLEEAYCLHLQIPAAQEIYEHRGKIFLQIADNRMLPARPNFQKDIKRFAFS